LPDVDLVVTLDFVAALRITTHVRSLSPRTASM
jgi:hypothetical protein